MDYPRQPDNQPETDDQPNQAAITPAQPPTFAPPEPQTRLPQQAGQQPASQQNYQPPVYQQATSGYNQSPVQPVSIEPTGSIARGVIGALCGAILGAIPWAIVYSFGWVSAWLGMLIAFLAVTGYQAMGGRETRVKAVVVLAALVVGIVLGEVFGDMIIIAKMIANGEFGGGYDIADVPRLYLFLIFYDPAEFLWSAAKSMCMGIVFGFVGAYSTLKSVFETNEQ